MKKAADFIADNTFCIFFVVAAGFGVAFFGWSLGHRELLNSFVLDNQLPPEQRSELLRLLLSGIGLALFLWLGTASIFVLRQRAAMLWLKWSAVVALAVSLLAFVPVLALPRIESDHPFLILLLIGAMAAIAFVSANEMVKLRDGRPALLTARATRSGLAIAGILTLAYVVFMGVLTVARHNAFQTHAFDLGIHDQVVYNALHHGVLRSTQHGAEPINYLGEHFAPILYLLTPIYALEQDARTLLVLQSLLLGIGAIPVYLLAQQKTHSTILALSLAASYLLYPALHGVNTFDFHQIAPVVPLLLFSLYFLEIGRDVPFLVFLGLAMLTKEEVSLTVAVVGLYLFFVKRRYRLGLAVAATGLVYFAVIVKFVMPAFGRAPQVDRFSGIMAPGSRGFGGIAKTLLTNPLYIARYVFTNNEKLVFLAQLLVPVLFLPLLAVPGWIVALPALAVALLSWAETQYRLGYHYPATIIPSIYFLASLAGAKLDLRKYRAPALAVALLVASLAMNYEYGWLLGKRFEGIPRPNQHQQVVARMLAQVPQGASVSTMSDLVPHVSARDKVYLFPIVGDAEYLVFDASPTASFWPFENEVARRDALFELAPYLFSGQYGVVQVEDQCLLLKRGFDTARNAEGLKALFVVKYEAEQLRSDFVMQNLPDAAASGGVARVGTPGLAHENGKEALTYGPYDTLPVGHFRVHFLLKLDEDPGPGKMAKLDVFSAAMGGALASRDLTAADFQNRGQYQDFAVELDVPQVLTDLEYRVTYKGKGRLAVDYVQVTPTKVELPVATYGWNDMPGSESASAGGTPACQEASAVVDTGRTWTAINCGPLGLMAPGKYRLAFGLKPGAKDIPDQAALVDLLAPATRQKLAWRNVGGSDFMAADQVQKFAVDFATDQSQTGAMIRVLSAVKGIVQVEDLEVLYIADFGG